MRLWARQHYDFYHKLQTTGLAYTPIVSELAKDCCGAYEWMTAQMRERIGEPPLPEIFTPVWAWYQYNSRKSARPAYTPYGYEATESVMLELEVPDDQVLLSGYILWHHCLNGWPIASKAEMKELDEDIDAFRDSHPGKFFDDYPQELKDKVTATWVRVFDLYKRDPYYATKHPKNRSIQATLWLVRKEWVKSAVKIIVDEKKNVHLYPLE